MSAARVLVVGDDRFLQQACEASLRQHGFDVVTASDGEDGLRIARAAPPVDVILLDVLMPKIPGIDVLRALKDRPETAGIPVVLLSNSLRDDDRREALRLGAAGYHGKANLSLRALAVEMERLVRSRPSPGAAARRRTLGSQAP